MTTYNKLCIIAKSNHYLGCIEEASGDPKGLNCVLKSIVRRDEMTKLPLYSCQDTLAHQFLDFFEDKKIRDGLPVVEAPVVSLPPCNSELLCLHTGHNQWGFTDCHEVLHQGMCARSNAYLVAEGASTEHSFSHDRFHQLLPAVRCHSWFNEICKKTSFDINILKNYRQVSKLLFVSKVLE